MHAFAVFAGRSGWISNTFQQRVFFRNLSAILMTPIELPPSLKWQNMTVPG
jgi:hypothetical protein